MAYAKTICGFAKRLLHNMASKRKKEDPRVLEKAPVDGTAATTQLFVSKFPVSLASLGPSSNIPARVGAVEHRGQFMHGLSRMGPAGSLRFPGSLSVQGLWCQLDCGRA